MFRMFKGIKNNKNEAYVDPSEELIFQDEPERTEIYLIEDEFVSEWNKCSEREAGVDDALNTLNDKIIFEDDDALVEAHLKKYEILQKKRDIIFKRKSDIVHDIAVSLDLENRMYDFFSDPGVIVRALEDGRTTFEY